MSDKKRNDNEIIEDSLDQTAHEVVELSDDDLANRFIFNNEDALENNEAVLTNIDELAHESEIQVQEIQNIDHELFLRTQQEVSNKNIVLNRLLEEDYRKKFWVRNLQRVRNFFVIDKFNFNKQNYLSWQSATWVDFNKARIKSRNLETAKSNDLNNFVEIILRDQRVLNKFWVFEIFFSILFLLVNVTLIVLIKVQPIALTSNTAIYFNYFHQQLADWSITFSVLAMISLIVPFFFLFASWFIGINQVWKSKNFHFFMILFLFLTFILSLVSIGLFIAYFSYAGWNLWIPT